MFSLVVKTQNSFYANPGSSPDSVFFLIRGDDVTLEGLRECLKGSRKSMELNGVSCIFKTQMKQSPICVFKTHETPFISIGLVFTFRLSLKRYMFH